MSSNIRNALLIVATAASFFTIFGQATTVAPASKLNGITIPHSDNVRGYINLPTELPGDPTVKVSWKSSHPDIVSDRPDGKIAAGVVHRPPPGAKPAGVKLTACVDEHHDHNACRDFHLRIQPSVELAEFTRYGMANFARSNSNSGQQVFFATSEANEATTWHETKNGAATLISPKGMHATRDPVIVRSPEGDRFFLVATDLNVDNVDYGWKNWDWAQSGASRYIEVWESDDLRNWSEQRHVLVAPEEAGMTYAPEAIWDPEIGEYVVYWTSSMYPKGTYYTPNKEDPNGRYPLTGGQTLYATTRDFISFSPAKVMSGRPGHGTLDPVIIPDEHGYYQRIVSDRNSTGVNLTWYGMPCSSEDLYQERSRSILAPGAEWELIDTCITHKTMNTTYAEGPLVVKANLRDPRGKGYYMYADQKWAGSPSGQPMEQQYHPYWTNDVGQPDWQPIDWTRKPNYNEANGVIRHGHIWAITTAEHAALRGADLKSISLTPPTKTTYKVGEPLDLNGLKVSVEYLDGVVDNEVMEGYGGYSVKGYNPNRLGKQNVEVVYRVVDVVKNAKFNVVVVKGCKSPEGL
ncbi:putative arabinosidase [Emericellopsis atlantica]|uniref:Arabinosidase n=1 Tax=Emericellopsis atlantica TaxID=2614577 RepID=A0A9P7ZL16_9HYPO|nr:putative arabinosidase [Emericellopsis atlantica]KAG9253960.1 putative arabinosidase [Emericellopsis atlantica]